MTIFYNKVTGKIVAIIGGKQDLSIFGNSPVIDIDYMLAKHNLDIMTNIGDYYIDTNTKQVVKRTID